MIRAKSFISICIPSSYNVHSSGGGGCPSLEKHIALDSRSGIPKMGDFTNIRALFESNDRACHLVESSPRKTLVARGTLILSSIILH